MKREQKKTVQPYQQSDSQGCKDLRTFAPSLYHNDVVCQGGNMTLYYDFDGCEFDIKVGERECVRAVIEDCLGRDKVSAVSMKKLLGLICDETDFVENGLDECRSFLKDAFESVANERFNEYREQEQCNRIAWRG